jgi:hypothetical protein
MSERLAYPPTQTDRQDMERVQTNINECILMPCKYLGSSIVFSTEILIHMRLCPQSETALKPNPVFLTCDPLRVTFA